MMHQRLFQPSQTLFILGVEKSDTRRRAYSLKKNSYNSAVGFACFHKYQLADGLAKFPATFSMFRQTFVSRRDNSLRCVSFLSWFAF
jgi:hypothetical protein